MVFADGGSDEWSTMFSEKKFSYISTENREREREIK